MSINAKEAAEELAHYVKDVQNPPPGGAQLGSILGAYIFKAVLQDAGYAIVPLNPTAEVEKSFKRGWLRPFHSRYASLIEAAWPEAAVPQTQTAHPEPLNHERIG